MWGVYAGYELYEHVARPGAEEYIDNEKYEYKARDWDAAAESGRTLAPYLTRLNEHPARHHLALGDLQNLTVHQQHGRRHGGLLQAQDPAGRHQGHLIIVVVNVDPHGTRESTVSLDLAALELDPDDLMTNGGFRVDDLITGEAGNGASTTTSAWTPMLNPHTF